MDLGWYSVLRIRSAAWKDLCSTLLGNDQTLRNHYMGNMVLHVQNLFYTIFTFRRHGGYFFFFLNFLR